MIGFKNLLVLVSLIFICSCEDNCVDKGGHDSFLLKNESSKTIDSKIISELYDVIPDQYNPLEDQESRVFPYTSRTMTAGKPGTACYEQIFSDGKKAWLYFFDYDSLTQLSWDTVRITGRGILEKRLINLEYLQNTNFTITYP